MRNCFFKNISAEKSAVWWVIFIILSLAVFFLFTSFTYAKIDAISIWILSCVSILYLSNKKQILLNQNQKKVVVTAGIFLCLMSFFNISIGLGNPPYSIAEFTILLSGIGIILFGCIGYKKLIIPILFPLLAVFGFEFYDIFLRNEEWMIKPLVPPAVYLTTVALNFLGFDVNVIGNVINFNSLMGEPIYLAIVTDCTGIWSLGTFTVALLIVIFTFPNALTSRSIFLIMVGYLGTYLSNIGRIVLIALSGYYYGPSGVIELVHIHTGWVMFTLWMIVFWYYFLICHLGMSFWGRSIPSD